ncbi:MAG: DUF4388 domain-containing protein [Acidobacteria bacterium]|nr:DUF4388 domain-containing protein [Acidobacteriota bacterium]
MTSYPLPLVREVITFLGETRHEEAEGILARFLREALSATPAPAVRQALEWVHNRFPDHELGRAAFKALQNLSSGSEPTGAPSEKLLGDLELFSLPELLRRLIRSQLTGVLIIRDRQANLAATMTLRGGRLQSCESGPLEGKAAIRQLLVNPVPGTFAFLGRRDRSACERPGAEEDQDLGPLIIEGIGLHDEVQQARALVPDGCCLKPTGTEPVMRPDEQDPALFRQVWNRIGTGATPEECEAGLEPETYKARLLLARWVEDLVLTVV